MSDETCTMERTHHRNVSKIDGVDIEIVRTGLGPYVVVKTNDKTVNVSVVDGYISVYVDGKEIYNEAESMQ